MTMTECPFQLQVQALHDGQLDRAAQQAVEAHVAACPDCAATLRGLRDLSQMFGPLAVAADRDPTPAELQRLYQAVDDESARRDESSSLLRLGGMLTGLAASILIISAAWLAEGPGPSTSPTPGRDTVALSPDEDWQRVAVAAQADPRPRVTQQSDSPYATHLADQQMSGWMIFNLDPTEH